jgi:hypothetical protein
VDLAYSILSLLVLSSKHCGFMNSNFWGHELVENNIIICLVHWCLIWFECFTSHMVLLIILFVGSKCIELAINLMQLLVHKLKVDNMSEEKLQGMTSMV